jgi:YggT family protein
MSSLGNVLAFLLETLLNLYLFVIILRFLLQWSGVYSYNPVRHFTVALTEPLLQPFRRFIPRFHQLDVELLLLLLAVELVKILVLYLFTTPTITSLGHLFIWIIADILNQTISVLFFSLLLLMLLNWLRPTGQNAVADALYYLTEPMLRPLRRFIPLIAGFDITPLVAILLLKLIQILLLQPLLS